MAAGKFMTCALKRIAYVSDPEKTVVDDELAISEMFILVHSTQNALAFLMTGVRSSARSTSGWQWSK